jgi:hypothetical protein
MGLQHSLAEIPDAAGVLRIALRVRCGQQHSSFRETSRLLPSKVACVAGSNGMAEAVPFPKPKQPKVFQQSETGQAPSLHEYFRSL